MPKYFVPTAKPASPRASRRIRDGYGETAQPDWRTVDWRAHLRQVEINGRPVNYVDIGSGPRHPVVFVHGLGGQWQNWLENIPRAAQERRVIALDLPGFGLSPLPREEITIPRYGRTVNELCERLGLGQVEMVGNSMGGFISAEMVVSQPVRVRKLALVSAAGVSHARMRRRPAETAARMARAAAPIGMRLHERGLRRPRVRRRMLRNIFHDPSAIRPELSWEFLHHGINAPGFVAAMGALIGYDILDRLEEVDIPTLIVWGRNDRVVPPGDALEYQRRLKNSELVVFERCGHIPMAERPVRFNRVLENFLKS